MNLLRKIGLLTLVVTTYTGQAQAETFNFTCITNSNADNCDIGEDQLSVDITDGGSNKVDFTFNNVGSGDATIAEIYFDDGTLLGISTVTGSSNWVKFFPGDASPPELPGANSMEDPFETTAGFLADAKNPAPKYGVSAGESLIISFDLINGFDYLDTIEAMGTDLRIGLHVISIGEDGESESFVAPAVTGVRTVPVPAAVWLFGSALIGLVGVKRKR